MVEVHKKVEQDEFDENLEKMQFKLNDGKIFPRQSPRRFFKSYRGFLHMFSMSLYELNGGGEAFFCA